MTYMNYLKNYFPSKNEIYTEIINLKAILNLPKGTEHFVSDLHGEYDAFQHVLRNGSGMILDKVSSCFKDKLSVQEIKELVSLIYYPSEKLPYYFEIHTQTSTLEKFYKVTIEQLIEIIHFSSTKYTRSKVRKALPKDFAYVTEELLYKVGTEADKNAYYEEIISEIIHLGQAPKLIIGLSDTIKRLVVDHLHVVGDIYDRGPAPDKIIDTLINHHSVDIQWGNHDIVWIGAAGGSDICMMNVLRVSARYNNLNIIEDVYGINLRPLLTFAKHHYQDNPAFRPKLEKDCSLTNQEILQITQIHQAVAIMQFKLESALIKRRPEFNMDHRLLLDKIDYTEQTILINNKKYQLENTCFQTILPNSPDTLLDEEKKIIQQLVASFTHSEKLKKHTDFLMEKGGLFLCYNGNLLIHGCIPLNEDGSFKEMTYLGQAKSGKALLDIFNQSLISFYKKSGHTTELDRDMVWYLWTGECSSLFGKKEMTTFERYFIKDKTTHVEEKNSYYSLRNNEEICKKILREFDLNPESGHIINGHTPVKEIKGENPMKANKKMIVIDGGFSKPYQSTTGIAGYTLLSNSYGMQLVAHQPFTSKKDAIENGTDIISTKRVVDRPTQRTKVRDTDIGKNLLQEINDLEYLLRHFF